MSVSPRLRVQEENEQNVIVKQECPRRPVTMMSQGHKVIDPGVI